MVFTWIASDLAAEGGSQARDRSVAGGRSSAARPMDRLLARRRVFGHDALHRSRMPDRACGLGGGSISRGASLASAAWWSRCIRTCGWPCWRCRARTRSVCARPDARVRAYHRSSVVMNNATGGPTRRGLVDRGVLRVRHRLEVRRSIRRPPGRRRSWMPSGQRLSCDMRRPRSVPGRAVSLMPPGAGSGMPGGSTAASRGAIRSRSSPPPRARTGHAGGSWIMFPSFMAPPPAPAVSAMQACDNAEPLIAHPIALPGRQTPSKPER